MSFGGLRDKMASGLRLLSRGERFSCGLESGVGFECPPKLHGGLVGAILLAENQAEIVMRCREIWFELDRATKRPRGFLQLALVEVETTERVERFR